MHTVDTMSNNLKLRVHIAPVGFELDRIVIPAKKMRADKVWLISHTVRSADKARPFLEKIKKTLEKNLPKHSQWLENSCCWSNDGNYDF